MVFNVFRTYNNQNISLIEHELRNEADINHFNVILSNSMVASNENLINNTANYQEYQTTHEQYENYNCCTIF